MAIDLMEAIQAIAEYLPAAALVAGYIVLGVFCTPLVWRASLVLRIRLLRQALASLVVAAFFAPGFIAAGHGVALVPAWLMYASGTFNILAPEAITYAFMSIPVTWLAVVVCARTVGWVRHLLGFTESTVSSR